jgi:hypothetical protein
MTKIFFAVLLSLLFTSCIASQNGAKRTHVEGHWTEGAVYSWFKPIDSKTIYWFTASNLPKKFESYWRTLPSHPDSDSESGNSVSIYMNFDGVLYDDPTLPLKAIRVTQLYSYGPPKKTYVDSLLHK